MDLSATCPADIAALRDAISAHLDRYGMPEAETLEQRCRCYLEALRWQGGVSCPRCEERRRLLWLESRSKWHCDGCRYQFSVTAGTFFHRSHFPVWKWFVAVHLMVESPAEVSANELRQLIGGSYKTAWFATHRVRAAMRGSGAEILQSVIRAEHEEQTATLGAIDQFREDSAELTDAERQALRVRVRRLLPGHPHHYLSAKYLHAYLDERRWCLAQLDNPHAFRDTIRALLHGDGLSYQQLTATR